MYSSCAQCPAGGAAQEEDCGTRGRGAEAEEGLILISIHYVSATPRCSNTKIANNTTATRTTMVLNSSRMGVDNHSCG